MKRYRAPSPVEKVHRFQVALPLSLDAVVKDYAQNEQRSLATMTAILVAEAVKARREKEADDALQKKDLRRS